MKKRLLCLIMTIIMVLPLILTSCGDDKTAEEIANENFQEADKALTLSVWLPAPKVDSNFEARLDAVEAAINDILRSGNYCTELEFHVFSEDTYYDELTAKFASIKETEKTNGMANITANKYVNHAVKNPETGIYEMAYPDVLDTQLDIFFVGGYSNYYSYIASGDTYALNEFFTEGQVFNGLFKRIRNVFMSAMVVDGKYHAIPNNHVYAENGQYVLVNKDLFDSNANVAWNDSFGLYDLKEYIESIGALNLENVVPFVGTTEDIPGVVYLDRESLIAGSIANGTVDANGNLSCEPDFLYNLNEYVDYISFYKELSEKSFVSNSLADGEKAAVRIVNGTSLSLAEYADDYYMIETVPAYADIETMYSSMFAISSHSADYKRAMQILYLFQDNTEIRTLLQYGIKDVDYTVTGTGDEATVNKNDTGYDMNLLYTGNCYRTYPDNGMPLEYWDSVKDFNLTVSRHPYLAIQANIASGKLSAEDAQNLANYLQTVANANNELKVAFDNLSSYEFKYIFDALSYGKGTLENQKGNAEKNLTNAETNYNNAVTDYENATTDEERQAAEANMVKYSEEIVKQEGLLDRWSGALECYEKYNSTLKGLYKFADRNSLIELYKSLG